MCGEERMLAHVVTLAYREQLSDAEHRAAWVDEPGWWDDVLSVPSGPRLTVVWNAEHLGDLSPLQHLLGDEMDGSYTVFVSAEHDFRKKDRELVSALAALRDSRHGQIIRCSTPASQEDQAAIVASWWPGAGKNIAAALLEASGGSLTGAWHAVDKAVRAGFPCDPSVIPVVCVSRDAEGFADLLTEGSRAAAMAAARTLPQDEAGGVLGLLAVRLQLLPLVRDAVERGEDMQSMVRNLKASQLVLSRLRTVAPRYGDSRVSRCRELLAIAETAWRSGARDGVLEAVAALWLRIRSMSETRDPDTDQPLPEPGKEPVHKHVAYGITDWKVTEPVKWAVLRGLLGRLALGVAKYGRPLESGNGRDALTDAWEEALDALVYTDQMALEGHPDGPQAVQLARQLVLLLADSKLDRGDPDVQ